MPELDANEWSLLAEWVRTEFDRRKQARKFRERDMADIDRQIAMMPKARKKDEEDPTNPAWYPDIELPLQFNALEVIMADVRRLTFPRVGPWYKASAAITDEYRDRWDKNRLKQAIVGQVPLEMMLDQETADVLVMQTLEHFHRMYDFRAGIGLFNSEQVKYGTGVVRVRKVKAGRSAHEYRGQWSDQTVGPKVIPCTLWHTYLDDSYSALLHEGEQIGPTIFRWIGSQPLEDLKRAAAEGGADAGYIKNEIDLLIGKIGPDGQKDRVELIEVEGDILVSKTTQGSIYLPNSIIEVASSPNGKTGVVRFQTNPMPFRSYVVGHYFKHDGRHAYGDSPLMKGIPIQDLASATANDFLAASRLRTLPVVVWDRTDPTLLAQGGPKIFPGAQWQSDAPDSITVPVVTDPTAALNAMISMVKLHEDTTGSNDARRGERLKSHTTAEAANIEASQGISRTDDFVTDNLAGPMTTILHMEYEIAKASMKKPQYIRIAAEGMDGWVKLSGTDLPDMVEFDVIGAEGNLEERQRTQSFMGASQFVLGVVAPAAAQFGAVPLTVNHDAIAREVYERSGTPNADKFIGPVAAITQGAAAESIIPGIAGATPQEAGGPEAEGIPAGGQGGPANGMGPPIGSMPGGG